MYIQMNANIESLIENLCIFFILILMILFGGVVFYFVAMVFV